MKGCLTAKFAKEAQRPQRVFCFDLDKGFNRKGRKVGAKGAKDFVFLLCPHVV